VHKIALSEIILRSDINHLRINEQINSWFVIKQTSSDEKYHYIVCKQSNATNKSLMNLNEIPKWRILQTLNVTLQSRACKRLAYIILPVYYITCWQWYAACRGRWLHISIHVLLRRRHVSIHPLDELPLPQQQSLPPAATPLQSRGQSMTCCHLAGDGCCTSPKDGGRAEGMTCLRPENVPC